MFIFVVFFFFQKYGPIESEFLAEYSDFHFEQVLMNAISTGFRLAIVVDYSADFILIFQYTNFESLSCNNVYLIKNSTVADQILINSVIEYWKKL